jgi:hypothetical protein
VKAKARNEIVAETLHGDPLSPRPHTQVRRGSKLIPGMLPGKAHDGELLGKRVEMRLEICGFNTSQDARLLEILMKQGASLASRLSARLPGGVYDYADLRSPGSFTKVLRRFTVTESQPAGLRIFLDSAYHRCFRKMTRNSVEAGCGREPRQGGIGVVSFVYGLLTVPRAMHRPFWYDEMATWHVARQPSLRAIIEMLHLGVDSEMPLTHFIVRASHMLFGTGYLATRLPMLIGFWLMLLGVFVFLNRRLPLPYALVGMIFPMLTFAWPYAFEARAYGVVLGAAAITLVAWQNVGLNYRRTASLIAIAVGLATVLGTQAMMAVVAIPFALGEVVRSIDRRRIDWGVWVAFAASMPVMVVYPIVLARMWEIDVEGLQAKFSNLSNFIQMR